MVRLWALPTGKRNRYDLSRGAAGIKLVEVKMRIKDILGKGRTVLLEGRESRGRFCFCSGESESNAFWKEENEWRRGGL